MNHALKILKQEQERLEQLQTVPGRSKAILHKALEEINSAIEILKLAEGE